MRKAKDRIAPLGLESSNAPAQTWSGSASLTLWGLSRLHLWPAPLNFSVPTQATSDDARLRISTPGSRSFFDKSAPIRAHTVKENRLPFIQPGTGTRTPKPLAFNHVQPSGMRAVGPDWFATRQVHLDAERGTCLWTTLPGQWAC